MFDSTVISLACASIVFLYCVRILEVLLVWKQTRVHFRQVPTYTYTYAKHK